MYSRSRLSSLENLRLKPEDHASSSSAKHAQAHELAGLSAKEYSYRW